VLPTAKRLIPQHLPTKIAICAFPEQLAMSLQLGARILHGKFPRGAFNEHFPRFGDESSVPVTRPESSCARTRTPPGDDRATHRSAAQTVA